MNTDQVEYETDVLTWSEQQAALLHGVIAGEHRQCVDRL
jgi:hypothetical protein